MSKLRDKEIGPVSTEYHFDDNQVVINRVQDIEPILSNNKNMYTHNDGYSPSRELKRIARIPMVVLELWAKEIRGDSNWWAIPEGERKTILREKLNSSEFRYFRTSEVRM